MIHRMDPPADPDREPMPEHVEPMLARLSTSCRADETSWAFEIKWDGVRAIAYCEPAASGSRAATCNDITSHYPELRALGRALGSPQAVLDGEIVAFDEDGRPELPAPPAAHAPRLGRRAVRRRMAERPVTYMVFDLLYLDGRSL